MRPSYRPVSDTDHPEDPHVPDEALPPPPSREKPMGFWDHLEELRGVIVKSGVVFLIFAILTGVFVKEFKDVLMWPFFKVQADHPDLMLKLNVMKITEVFTMVLQLCLMGGLALSLPFMLYFIGQFVAPALTEKEMRAVLPMCISAMILFLAGSSFGFFVLMPQGMEMALQTALYFDFDINWTVGDYYDTLFWLTFGMGAAFEFPLVLLTLIWLGVLSTATLRKYRRHAIVGIVFLAAVVTPTTDPLSLLICAAPLYVLFEAALLVGVRIEKNRERRLLKG